MPWLESTRRARVGPLRGPSPRQIRRDKNAIYGSAGEPEPASTRFDEPSALKLLSTSRRVVALHGEGSANRAVVFLGGLDAEVGAASQRELDAAGFTVRSHETPELQGRSPENICNRGQTRCGVQLELSRGLRQQFFASVSPAGNHHRLMEPIGNIPPAEAEAYQYRQIAESETIV